MLRLATESDVTGLAAIQVEALPKDLLPRLGRRFLENCFYPAVLACPDAFILVEEREDDIDGFCIFVGDTGALTREILSRGLGLLSAILIRSFKDPGIMFAFAALVGTRIQMQDVRTSLPEPPLPEIYLMAVRKNRQGQGLGGRLIHEGVDRLRGRYRSCMVRTDKEDACRFYSRNGFVKFGLEKRGRRRFSLLVHDWSHS